MLFIKSLTAAVLLSHFISVSLTNSDKNTIRLKDGLTLDTLSPDRVDGYYYDPISMLGIVFNSTRDTLHVSDFSGQVLLGAKEKVGQARLVSLGKRQFLQHTDEEDGVSRDLAIPKSLGRFSELQDPSAFHSLLPSLRKIHRTTHAKVRAKSVKHLLTKPELKLLKEAAFELGNQGVTGIDYPSVLPFHMTALRTGSHDHYNTVSDWSNLDHHRLKRSACIQKCPPCKEKECFGMCGPGCSCWDFACGDCCYHKGCLYHDLCCRKQPSSTACLIPIDFTCSGKYKCTSD